MYRSVAAAVVLALIGAGRRPAKMTPLTIAVLGLALSCPGARLLAAPITYTFTGTATGFVGSTDFSEARFTINVFSDTSTVVGPGTTGTWFTADSPATIEILGLGLGRFSSSKRVFDNQWVPGLGINDRASNDLLDIGNSRFLTYDLRTACDPVFQAQPAYASVYRVPLDIGPLTFTSCSNVTFSATLVPEPSTLALLAAGSLALVGVAWRRKRA